MGYGFLKGTPELVIYEGVKMKSKMQWRDQEVEIQREDAGAEWSQPEKQSAVAQARDGAGA